MSNVSLPAAAALRPNAMTHDAEPCTWVTVGRVLRAHGVRGELHIAMEPATDVLGDLEGLAQVRLLKRQGDVLAADVTSRRSVHRGVLVTLAGLESREAAQAWAGASVQVDERDIPPPEAGEFYIYELTGSKVIDGDGKVLGTVREVLDNGGQGLLRVVGVDGERLLPLAPGVVERFDRAGRLLTVVVPAGLWE